MFPYLIRIGGFSLPAYPLLYGAGIAVAGLLAIHLGKRQGLDPLKLAHVLMLTAIAIVIGGRIMYVAIYSSEFHSRWRDAFNLTDAGQVHYGGLILAVLVGTFATRKLRLPVGGVTDVFAVSAPLGVAIGRIGCLCRGCCFGRITDLPWSIRFPPFVDVDGNLVGSPAFLHHVESVGLVCSAAASYPVHPSQVYSSMLALLVFGIMLAVWRSGKLRGRLMLLYVCLYCGIRFLLEFTRVNVTAFWHLTIYQVFSVVIFIIALSACIVLSKGPRGQTESAD